MPANRTLYQWLHQAVVQPRFALPQNLTGKYIIVTGASPGSIGYACARTFAAWGATVIITSRNAPEEAATCLNSSLSTASEGRIVPASLDLTDRQSVSEFVTWYKATMGIQLDVLINNAGIHLDLLSQWRKPTLTGDGHEIHWRTNYLGTFDLTFQLLPHLLETAKRTSDARIVNVVSHLHLKATNQGLAQLHDPYNSWVAYGLSKLALVHMTLELQQRYATQGLNSFCLHPGAVYSKIADKGLEGARFLTEVRRVLAPMERFFMMNTEEGAQTTLYCATDPSAEGGRYYRKCQQATPSNEAQDREAGQRLWEETINWASA